MTSLSTVSKKRSSFSETGTLETGDWGNGSSSIMVQYGKYIEHIYFFCDEYQIYFECSEKISIFHECVAQVKMLIFLPHKKKYIWYSPKKVNFLFILYSMENTESTT